MSTSEILYAVGGAVLLAATHYVRTGKPPLFDPAGTYPVFDMLRDGARGFLSLFGPKDPPASA